MGLSLYNQKVLMDGQISYNNPRVIDNCPNFISTFRRDEITNILKDLHLQTHSKPLAIYGVVEIKIFYDF
jgi:hypothetical protein